jgi:hypothetical protein
VPGRLPGIDQEPTLIIQVPRGSAVERQLREEPPPAGRADDVVVEGGMTDEQGNLEPPLVGEVVITLPAPEALERQAEDVRRVLDTAGTGTEPLVIVVEAAEELREPELAPVVAAAERAPRPVVLRIIRPAER